MAKIALITDTHYGVKSGSKIYLDYFKAFYDNIFFPEIDKRGIKTVIHLGDIVDVPTSISFITMNRLKQDFLQPLEKRGIDFHYIVGNHDMPYRRSTELNAMSVIDEGRYAKIYWEPSEVFLHGRTFAFVPWITNESREDTSRFLGESEAEVVLGHLQIAGANMGSGIKATHGSLPSLFSSFDLVVSGHFHTRSTLGSIVYMGSPYHTYWDDYADPRGFAILDTDTLELEYIDNPYTVFYKLYYNDEKKSLDELTDLPYNHYKDTYIKVIVETKRKPALFDRWIKLLDEAQPASIEIIDVDLLKDNITEEEAMKQAKDTLEIMVNYVDEYVEEKAVDKGELKTLLGNLYREAQDAADL